MAHYDPKSEVSSFFFLTKIHFKIPAGLNLTNSTSIRNNFVTPNQLYLALVNFRDLLLFDSKINIQSIH